MVRRLLSVVSVCLMVGVVAPLGAPSASAVGPVFLPPPASIFHGVTPARLLDTRSGADKLTVDHLFEGEGALTSGGYLDLKVAGRAGSGVPENAGAVVLNVTAISPTSTGFITIYPQGGTQPNASSLNTAAGRTLPNMVIVPVGDFQGITIFNSNGTTHMAIDVLGWFPDVASAIGAVDPARLLETRSGPGKETIDHLVGTEGIGARGANSTTHLVIAGRGNVPLDAGAVALNVTAISPTANSFLTIFPKGAGQPNASNLNLAAGRTVPNMVIVPIGDDGSISIYNATGTTHLAVDVLAWFPDATTAFGGVLPARLLETRSGTGKETVDHLAGTEGIGARGANSTLELPVAGRGLVPADAAAVALNVTAIGPTANSFITVFPTGQSRPNASNLNLAAGRTLPNMVIVPLGTDGKISIYNASGSTHLAVDVLGWFPAGATTTRANVTSGELEANASSANSVISGDGLFVAFDSTATNLGTDNNAQQDVFVRDVANGTTELISKSTSGALGDRYSYVCDISETGRYVLFGSDATNFVTGHTGNLFDLFVRDRQLNTTTLVSMSTAGVQGDGDTGCGSISADGRYIAFHSGAANLDVDIDGTSDIFLRDRTNNTTTLISKSSGGTQGNGSSGFPDISADGSTVVYESVATNLVTGDTNAVQDIFAYDVATSTTTRVSVTSAEAQVAGLSEIAHVSGDGSLVTFVSYAQTIVPGKTSTAGDIIMRDTVTGTTTRVSVSSTGTEANSSSYYHDISADGNTIVFQSEASNLTTPAAAGNTNIFVHDIGTGETTQVSISTGGIPSGDFNQGPRVSDDGTRICFLSDDSALVAGDTNGVRDVLLHDRRG
jgi:cytochrome c556